MKKGQMSVSQVFIYILTIFVVAGTLLLGYKVVIYFLETGDQIAYQSFKSDFKEDVNRYMNYGDKKQVRYKVPGDVREVCFIPTHDSVLTGIDVAKHKGLFDDVDRIGGDIANPNVYLTVPYDTDYEFPPFFADDISTFNKEVFCEEVRSGEIEVFFRGYGSNTRVTKLQWSLTDLCKEADPDLDKCTVANKLVENALGPGSTCSDFCGACCP